MYGSWARMFLNLGALTVSAAVPGAVSRTPTGTVSGVGLAIHRWGKRIQLEVLYIVDIIYGYGSIPINTIFRGMNIHLPAILMFTRGTRF